MAYTRFQNGFKVGTASAIDERILISKADMLTIEERYMLPDNYFAICTDDGKLYLYNFNNESNSETGKYREITAELMEQLSTLSNSLGELADVARSGNYDDLVDKLIAGEGLSIEKDDEGNNVITNTKLSGWGSIQGILSSQLDLQQILDEKADASSLSIVATTGNYGDLNNTPTIPEEQIQSNYEEADPYSKSFILNKPTIGDATLTINSNSELLGTFSANSTENEQINIQIPTKVVDLSDNENYALKTNVTESLSHKVDKVEGKQLSQENFVTGYKTQLDDLANSSIDSVYIKTMESSIETNAESIESLNNDLTILGNTKQNLITSANPLDYSLLENTPSIPSIEGLATENKLNEEIAARQAADNEITTRINSEELSRVNELEEVRGDIATINNNLDNDVLSNIVIDVDGDRLTYTKTFINLSNPESEEAPPEVDNINLADEDKAGLMSPSNVTAINTLKNKVSMLEGKTSRYLYKVNDVLTNVDGNLQFQVSYSNETNGTYSVIYTFAGAGISATVTAGESSKQRGHVFNAESQLDEYQRVIIKIYELGSERDTISYHFDTVNNTIYRAANRDNINSFALGQGFVEPFDGVAIIQDEIYHVWRYYPNSDNASLIGWRDEGQDVVSNFTNSIAGIIKGSTTDGRVYAEQDGEGSVKGWDNLVTRVTNVEGQTSSHSTSIVSINESLGTKQDVLPSGSTNNGALRWNSTTGTYVPGIAGVLGITTEATSAINVNKTDNTVPILGLKLYNTNNNVSLSQSSNGLSANIADNALSMNKISGLSSAFDGKVDKVDGKGLSTNDFTTTEKNKLNGIATGANKYTHPSYGVENSNTSEALKIGRDATGHVVVGTKIEPSEVGVTIASDLNSITITEAGTSKTFNKYTHPTSYTQQSGFKKLTSDSQGHVSSATSVVASDITGLTPYVAGPGVKLTRNSTTGVVTVEQTYATITLGTTWSNLTQTVSLTGVTSNSHPVIDVLINNAADADNINENWSKVYKAITNDGSITFHATEATTVSLQLQVKGY